MGERDRAGPHDIVAASVAGAAFGSRRRRAGTDAARGNDQRPATRQRARRRGRDACHGAFVARAGDQPGQDRRGGVDRPRSAGACGPGQSERSPAALSRRAARRAAAGRHRDRTRYAAARDRRTPARRNRGRARAHDLAAGRILAGPAGRPAQRPGHATLDFRGAVRDPARHRHRAIRGQPRWEYGPRRKTCADVAMLGEALRAAELEPADFQFRVGTPPSVARQAAPGRFMDRAT